MKTCTEQGGLRYNNYMERCPVRKIIKNRQRKNGNDCYSMDLCAYGFETQGFALQTVSP